MVVKVTSCAIEATSSLNRNATLIRPSLANTHLEKTKQRRKLMHRSRVSAGPQSITGSKADEEMFNTPIDYRKNDVMTLFNDSFF